MIVLNSTLVPASLVEAVISPLQPNSKTPQIKANPDTNFMNRPSCKNRLPINKKALDMMNKNTIALLAYYYQSMARIMRCSKGIAIPYLSIEKLLPVRNGNNLSI